MRACVRACLLACAPSHPGDAARDCSDGISGMHCSVDFTCTFCLGRSRVVVQWMLRACSPGGAVGFNSSGAGQDTYLVRMIYFL